MFRMGDSSSGVELASTGIRHSLRRNIIVVARAIRIAGDFASPSTDHDHRDLPSEKS
jgi:hypothetical protein